MAKAVDSFMPVVLNNPGTAGAKAFTLLTQEFLEKVRVVTDSQNQLGGLTSN